MTRSQPERSPDETAMNLCLAGSIFIRVLHATLRVRHVHAENIESQPQYILAFWHAHLLLMLHSAYRRPIVVMISRSKDGEYIARVFDHYGVESARGSSTRGGTPALREMIRAAREGKTSSSRPMVRKVRRAWPKTASSTRRRRPDADRACGLCGAKKKLLRSWTRWSSRCRSRVHSSSTARHSASLAARMWRKRGNASSAP